MNSRNWVMPNWTLSLVMMMVMTTGCAATVASSSTRSAVASSSAPTLPGESANDAMLRLLDQCMAAYGEIGVQADAESDGVKSKRTGYHTDTPDGKKHFDDCSSKAEAAVPIAPLSKADLRSLHDRFASVLACVRDGGVDVGTMISADEFVAKGGASNGLTSRWEQLAADPAFNERFVKCSRDIPSFVPSS